MDIGQRPARKQVKHGRLWAALGALVLTCGYFFRAVLSDERFTARDNLRVYLPILKYWAERVRAGQVPEWYPYDGFGQPLAAAMVSAVFHPSKLLAVILPLHLAFKVSILLCFPLALLGMAGLVRQWGLPRTAALFAGATYAFSGYFVCITNNPPYLMAATAVPWGLWATERLLRAPGAGRGLLAGGSLALVLLAGDPQSFAVTCALALLLALMGPSGQGRRRLVAAAGAVGVAALLAAPQLLAAVSVLDVITPGARSLEEAQRFALHPLRLPELVLGPLFVPPGALTAPEEVVRALLPSGFSALWVDSAFLGVPAVLLAFTTLGVHRRSWRAWVWTGAGLLLLLLALGPSTPLYGSVYRLLPLWRPFRYPEKLLPLFLLGASIAAALGWQAVFHAERPGRRLFAGLGLALALLCTALALAEGSEELWSHGVLGARAAAGAALPLEALGARFSSGAGLAALAALACAGAALLRDRLAVGAALLALVQLGTGFSLNEPLYELTRADITSQTPVFAQVIAARRTPEDPAPARVGSPRGAYGRFEVEGYSPEDLLAHQSVSALSPDTAGLWGIENAEDYLPAVSSRVREARASPFWYRRISGLLGVEHTVFLASEFARYGKAAGSAVARDGLLVLSRPPEVRPRAYFAVAQCVGTAREALALIAARPVGAPALAAVECLETALPRSAPVLAPPGLAHVTVYAPERVELQVEAQTAGVVVLNDAFYPGWSASVDGEAAPLLAANGAVRAVPVGPGSHTVVFTFRAPGVRTGLWAAGLTVLALCVLALLQRRRRASPGNAVHGRTVTDAA